MSGMTLTDFLLARIAEDEVFGRAEHPSPVMRDYAARVLAEGDTKRRIVEYAGHIAADPTLPSTHLARHVLADLALLYADHPDYNPDWRP